MDGGLGAGYVIDAGAKVLFQTSVAKLTTGFSAKSGQFAVTARSR